MEETMVKHRLRTGMVVVGLLIGATPAINENAGLRAVLRAASQASKNFELLPAMVFTSTRDNAGIGSGTIPERVYNAAELYRSGVGADDRAGSPRRGPCYRDPRAEIAPSGLASSFSLASTIAFSSNRDNVTVFPLINGPRST
jgi:hypothetical protein